MSVGKGQKEQPGKRRRPSWPVLVLMVLFVILVVVWSIALLKGDGSAKKPANLPMDQAGP